MRLLLVEDDTSLGATLKNRLEKEGHTVDWSDKVEASVQYLKAANYDLVILDVGLPDGNGFELAKEVRRLSKAPFIFVTAQTSAEDRLAGYELGAEEYIPKPFHLQELLIRVRHVLANHSRPQVLRLGALEVDFESQKLHREDGEVEALPARDCLVLQLLMERSPAVVSRDDLIDRGWGKEQNPSHRTVDNIISRWRQLLGEPWGLYIKSVRGVGYQWLPEEEDNGQ